MRSFSVDHGWYSDITLDGDYCALIRDEYIIVNGTIIGLPFVESIGKVENVLFLVMKRWNGQILLAGQGNITDFCWLYRDNAWKALDLTFGTFPCAFGVDSLYFVCANNQYRIYYLDDDRVAGPVNRIIGSQGIHYIDWSQSIDGIVTGDSTYGPAPYNLSQWTSRDNLTLGQSHDDDRDDGLGLLYPTYYKFINGPVNFIRYYRSVNDLAFCCVNQPENYSTFYWMTLGEFKSFPVSKEIIDVGKAAGPINSSCNGKKN